MTSPDNKPLMSGATARRVSKFVKKPAHAILITGQAGAGKFTIAKHLAAKLLGFNNLAQLEQYPYYYAVKRDEGKQDISIDAVRELLTKLKLYTPGTSAIRRLVIIEDAHYLSRQAQNSLLKTLEEAPEDTVIILTSPTESEILPTIISRSQKLPLQPISLKAAADYWGQDEDKIRPNWLLSRGGAGLLRALMEDDSTHPLKRAVEDFKLILSQGYYERLKTLDKFEKNRQELELLLDAGSRILAVLHKDAVRKNNLRAKKQLQSRKLLLKTTKELRAGTSPRLIILNLALHLGV